jgi:tetratricopeptide (TPR) repeat protein
MKILNSEFARRVVVQTIPNQEAKKRGMDNLLRGQLEQSAQVLCQLGNDPEAVTECAIARLNLGIVHFNCQRDEVALSFLKRAVYDPYLDNAKHVKGLLELGIAYLDSKNYEQAILCLTPVHDSADLDAEDWARACLNLGIASANGENQEDHRSAIRFLQRAYASDKLSQEARGQAGFYLATVFFHCSQDESAIPRLNEAFSDPNLNDVQRAQAHFYFGIISFDKRRYALAAQHLELIVGDKNLKEVDRNIARLSLAISYVHQHQYKEAILSFSQLIDQPDSYHRLHVKTDSFLSRIIATQEIRETDRAKAHLEQAIYHIRIQNYKLATELSLKALEGMGAHLDEVDRARAHLYLGIAYVNQRKYPAAFACLNRAQEGALLSGMEEMKAVLWIGIAQIQCRNYGPGIGLLIQTLENPHLNREVLDLARFWLGIAYVDCKESRLAIPLLTQFLDDPHLSLEEQIRAHLYLGMAHMQFRNYETALPFFIQVADHKHSNGTDRIRIFQLVGQIVKDSKGLSIAFREKVLLWFGMMQVHCGEYRRAIESLKPSLEARTLSLEEKARGRLELGIVYVRLQKYESAIPLLGPSILNPYLSEAHREKARLWLGMMHLRSERYRAAEPLFIEVMEHGNTDIEDRMKALLGYSIVLHHNAHYVEAILNLSQVISSKEASESDRAEACQLLIRMRRNLPRFTDRLKASLYIGIGCMRCGNSKVGFRILQQLEASEFLEVADRAKLDLELGTAYSKHKEYITRADLYLLRATSHQYLSVHERKVAYLTYGIVLLSRNEYEVAAYFLGRVANDPNLNAEEKSRANLCLEIARAHRSASNFV